MADLEADLSTSAVQKIYDQILTAAGNPRPVKLRSDQVKLKARVDGKDITLLKFDMLFTLDKLKVSSTNTGVKLEADTTFKFSSLPELTGNDGKITVNVHTSYNEIEAKIEFNPSTGMLPIKTNFFESPALQMVVPLQFTMLKIGLPLAANEFSLNFPEPFKKPRPLMVKTKKAVAKPGSNKVTLEVDSEVTSM
jgi:hypothetical protein